MAAEFTSFPARWREGVMHNDLWRYACALYARPGMEAACLAAQAGGSNVCLALCALWLEQQGVAWSPARAQALEAIALPWSRTVVEPLRALRQQWRLAAQADDRLAALRAGVKALELEAEQGLLARLQAAAAPWPTCGAAQPEWLGWAVPEATTQATLRATAASA
jgi:uncharacterized protein (TIGR02444 family)